MFNTIAEPRVSKLRRWYTVAAVLYFGMAVVDAVSFWHKRDAIDALNAALWLVLGITFAYRERHIGEPQVTSLNISGSTDMDEQNKARD